MSLPAAGADRAAIVTGASSGIGAAIARELVHRGHRVVLVARRADRLAALAAELGEQSASALPADLSVAADRAALPARIAALGLVPDILVNNAGLAVVGQVARSAPDRQLEVVDVDVAAVVDLCGRFVPGMVERGRGAVLNLASVAGFGPLPGQATYGAAKAFVLSYTDSLRGELRGTGVTATVLCPGPVDTDLDVLAGFRPGERRTVLPRVMWRSADQVARAGIDGLARNKARVTPGLANRALVSTYRVVPHWALLPLLARRMPLAARTRGNEHSANGGSGLVLEVIEKGCASSEHPVPVLFVHGAWHAAWCWDEHFLSYFADRGYHSVAVSFRGHGNSSIDKPLRSCRVDDYVADIVSVAESLPVPPVVIGHSMGGLIVQKYLESHPAPAGVLMTSIPPQGSYGSNLRWLLRRPGQVAKMMLTGRSLPYLNTPALAREKFFSEHTPEAQVVDCAVRLQEDSARVSLDCVLLRRPKPQRVSAPMLVLGAEQDSIHTPAEIEATARAYHTAARFFPDMGHDMMLEPGWEAVADGIDGWLVEQGL